MPELDRKALKEAALPDVLDGHWTTEQGRDMAEFYAKQERKHLGKPDLSDFALANAVFMADRSDLDLIVYQTAAKERIRWLSAQVAILTARAEAAEPRERRLREALMGLVALEAPITAKDPFGAAVVEHWTEQKAQGHGYAHLYLTALTALSEEA